MLEQDAASGVPYQVVHSMCMPSEEVLDRAVEGTHGEAAAWRPNRAYGWGRSFEMSVHRVGADAGTAGVEHVLHTALHRPFRLARGWAGMFA